MYGRSQFVGLSNFIGLLFDDRFITSMGLTCLFVAVAVPAEFLLGLGFALTLHKEIPGGRTIRSMVLLPYVAVPVVIGLTWRILFNYQAGLVNYLLYLIGLPKLLWLSTPHLAFLSVLIADLWRWSPFATLMILAGLRAIPVDLFEAAEVDGATSVQKLIWITLPMLKPIILVVLLLRTIGVFKIFDLVYMLTEGGPGNATDFISFYIFKVGFRIWNLGEAAAASYYLLLIILGITFILMRQFRTT